MLFPLMRRRYLGFSEIGWLSCDVCDYATPLLARPIEFSPEHAGIVWAAVRSVLPPSDRIRIEAIPEELAGTVQNPLSQLEGARGSGVTAYGIALSGPTDSLLKRLCKPAFSNKIGRKWRQLEKLGTVCFQQAQTSEELDLVYKALLQQRHRRFKELGRFDLLENKKYRRFYREAAGHGEQASAVRIFGLKVDDEWIATFYILVHAGYAHAILLTMDQGKWKRMAPGLLIIARTMEWANDNGLIYFDLSVGNRYYKEQIGAGARPLLSIDESLTGTGALVAHIHHGVQRASIWAKKQPRLVAGVKAWRSRLRKILTARTKG
jgi:CelD/BcsL family acetyltransferase involved in cellulose biosynthesis